MFRQYMNDIYERFSERTDSEEGELFIVVLGRSLCLSMFNIVKSFLQMFVTLGEGLMYGLSYVANLISYKKK